MIRSKLDQRSLLALPAYPGGAVRWVDPIEGIAPWTFPTRVAAERARDMCADCGEVVDSGLTHVSIVKSTSFSMETLSKTTYRNLFRSDFSDLMELAQ